MLAQVEAGLIYLVNRGPSCHALHAYDCCQHDDEMMMMMERCMDGWIHRVRVIEHANP